MEIGNWLLRKRSGDFFSVRRDIPPTDVEVSGSRSLMTRLDRHQCHTLQGPQQLRGK